MSVLGSSNHSSHSSSCVAGPSASMAAAIAAARSGRSTRDGAPDGSGEMSFGRAPAHRPSDRHVEGTSRQNPIVTHRSRTGIVAEGLFET
jgi:hypothetical protein